MRISLPEHQPQTHSMDGVCSYLTARHTAPRLDSNNSGDESITTEASIKHQHRQLRSCRQSMQMEAKYFASEWHFMLT